MTKRRLAVICPGRGSYTKDTLGYLKKYGGHIGQFLDQANEKRRLGGDPPLTELDEAPAFKPQLHMRGEHASSLIYACSYADFMALDRERFEVVAITGNSMGWYITLALAGALSPQGGYDVIQTMGSMMREQIIGGQIIYPIIDENWRIDKAKQKEVEGLVEEVSKQSGAEAYVSIYLGGYLVLAGNEEGLSQLSRKLPPIEHYPFRLLHHAAFHTPMLKEVTNRALKSLPISLFKKPEIPMVDGRGVVWSPWATEVEELYSYTFGHQVTETYDFTQSVSVILKEFAPDLVVLLGPGNTLGGAVGQTMIMNNWHNVDCKEAFSKMQKENPYLISMGLDDQRKLVTKE